MLRLSFDLGSTSLGWCLLAFDDAGFPTHIVDAGVRIFDNGRDPQSNVPNAVSRREARSARKGRDRYLRRRSALLRELIKFGLLPAEKSAQKALEHLCPYRIRRDCLDQPLHPFHVGRAIFHLNQRRGFKSNRKTDLRDGEAQGVIAAGAAELDQQLKATGARTYGEFLALRKDQGLGLRLRSASDNNSYDFYPTRAHLEAEFNTIWNTQKSFSPQIFAEDAKNQLFDIIFYQRPLKPPKVGKCSYSDEERLHRASPLFQRFRLLKELNELYIVTEGQGSVPLTIDQRALLLKKLHGKKSVSFKSLGGALKLAANQRFNKDTETRSKLEGDTVSADMLKRFGPSWDTMESASKEKLIDRLLKEQDPDQLLDWLKANHGLVGEQAILVANCALPEGTGRLGPTVTARLVDIFESQIITEAAALQRLGLHHSDRRTGEILEELPYYGAVTELSRMIPPGTEDPDDPEEIRLGKITNPTVHIALNQVRRLTNAVIKKYGKPDQIHIEMARDLKLSEKQKAQLNKQNNINKKNAERRSQVIRDLGQRDTGRNRALLALWEDLHPDPKARCCPYTGEHISPSMLFSAQTDVDHILPLKRTLDDTNANKTICIRHANRDKGDLSPYEKWGETDAWAGIAARAASLPSNKRWRFQPDAMQQLEDDDGWAARQLKDTQYMSRVVKSYLEALYPEKGPGSRRVLALPGRLTALLRRKWGLNNMLPDALMADEQDISLVHAKNRLDHRHHLIDAFVVGLSDSAMLQRIAQATAQNREGKDTDPFKEIPEPWPGFRSDLQRQLDRTTVYHRPRHRGPASKRNNLENPSATTFGKLHQETAYGIRKSGQKDGGSVVRHRVGLGTFKSGKKLSEIEDPQLRLALEECLYGLDSDKEREKALADFAKHHPHYKGIRGVRITENLKVIAIKDENGKAFKGYKGGSNFSYQIWRLPNGAWTAYTISMFEAHGPHFNGQPHDRHPAAKFVMELRQNDMILLEEDGAPPQILRVVKFAQSGSIVFAPHQEAGALKARDQARNDPFKYINRSAKSLQKGKARRVRIDELGHVFDPGPRDV